MLYTPIIGFMKPQDHKRKKSMIKKKEKKKKVKLKVHKWSPKTKTWPENALSSCTDYKSVVSVDLWFPYKFS